MTLYQAGYKKKRKLKVLTIRKMIQKEGISMITTYLTKSTETPVIVREKHNKTQCDVLQITR